MYFFFFFLPTINKNSHSMLIKIYMTIWSIACYSLSLSPLLKHTIHCACIHCFFSINIQQALININGCHFFLHGLLKFHTFATSALPCQTPLYQSAPLLQFVTWQQNVRECCLKDSFSIAILLTDLRCCSQYNSIGGIAFRAALVFIKLWINGDRIVTSIALL